MSKAPPEPHDFRAAAEALLRDSRGDHAPRDADRERVREALAQRIAAGGAGLATEGSGAAGSASLASVATWVLGVAILTAGALALVRSLAPETGPTRETERPPARVDGVDIAAGRPHSGAYDGADNAATADQGAASVRVERPDATATGASDDATQRSSDRRAERAGAYGGERRSERAWSAIRASDREDGAQSEGRALDRGKGAQSESRALDRGKGAQSESRASSRGGGARPEQRASSRAGVDDASRPESSVALASGALARTSTASGSSPAPAQEPRAKDAEPRAPTASAAARARDDARAASDGSGERTEPQSRTAAPASKPVQTGRGRSRSEERAVDPRAELEFVRGIQAALREAELDDVLTLCAEHERRWPRGTFAQEREGLRAIATCRSGGDSAAALARDFFAAYPHAPMAVRVRTACSQQLKAAEVARPSLADSDPPD